MAIETLRSREYPGGDFTIEQTLPNGSNYKQYVVSYYSEGLKIYGLLTVPLSKKPEKGFPAIVFVHGYIPPKKYSTTGSYATYQPRLARGDFITFKPDLRGHGNSEGEPVSAHTSEKYVVDTMYAIAYLKQYKDTDPERIGYWGHSNGGEIGLRVLVISKDLKAASLWGGVVGSYEDMWETYNKKIPFLKNRVNPLITEHGLPGTHNEFWKRVDPYYFLDAISIAIQLQHGEDDNSVPIELTRHLYAELQKRDKHVVLYTYKNDNHNISHNVDLAFKRDIDFFRAAL